MYKRETHACMHTTGHPTRQAIFDLYVHDTARTACTFSADDAMPGAVKVILDTDMGGGGCQDADDVGTLALANAMVDNGEVELLAILLNTLSTYSARVIGILQSFYGKEDVPIGVYVGTNKTRPKYLRRTHSYTKVLSKEWDKDKISPLSEAKEGEEAEEAEAKEGEEGEEGEEAEAKEGEEDEEEWDTQIAARSKLNSSLHVYRRVLASQPDNSVVLVSVGTLANLAALLRSRPDDLSPLSGPELLASKVRRLAIMGGRYPSGRECNFMETVECEASGECEDVLGAMHAVAAQLPGSVEVIYVGQEIGLEIMHGGALSACAMPTSPVRRAYVEFLGGPHRDRFSWDPLTLLVGVRGANGVPGIAGCDGCRGQAIVHPSGWNEWKKDASANQSYVVLAPAAERLEGGRTIDRLLCQTPAHFFGVFGALPQPQASTDSVCLHDPIVTGLPTLRNVVGDGGGGYGGECTCPDGQKYQVGDLYGPCDGLACHGGISGTCNDDLGPWSWRSVSCAPEESVLSLTVYAAPVLPEDGRLRTRTVPYHRGHGHSEPVCIRTGSPICFGVGTLAQGCVSATPAWLSGAAKAALSNGVTVAWQVRHEGSSVEAKDNALETALGVDSDGDGIIGQPEHPKNIGQRSPPEAKSLPPPPPSPPPSPPPRPPPPPPPAPPISSARAPPQPSPPQPPSAHSPSAAGSPLLAWRVAGLGGAVTTGNVEASFDLPPTTRPRSAAQTHSDQIGNTLILLAALIAFAGLVLMRMYDRKTQRGATQSTEIPLGDATGPPAGAEPALLDEAGPSAHPSNDLARARLPRIPRRGPRRQRYARQKDEEDCGSSSSTEVDESATEVDDSVEPSASPSAGSPGGAAARLHCATRRLRECVQGVVREV